MEAMLLKGSPVHHIVSPAEPWVASELHDTPRDSFLTSCMIKTSVGKDGLPQKPHPSAAAHV